MRVKISDHASKSMKSVTGISKRLPLQLSRYINRYCNVVSGFEKLNFVDINTHVLVQLGEQRKNHRRIGSSREFCNTGYRASRITSCF